MIHDLLGPSATGNYSRKRAAQEHLGKLAFIVGKTHKNQLTTFFLCRILGGFALDRFIELFDGPNCPLAHG